MTRPVQSAKLRLFVTNPSDQAGQAFSVSDNYQATTTLWAEGGINWNNAPTIAGTPLSSVGAATQNAWVEFDVTSAISGNGTISFGLKATSTDEVRFSSKEGDNPPQLVIEQELPPPPPVITSFTPPSGPVGTEVTIHGSQFNNVSAVTFNGVQATDYTVGSPSVIYALVPNGAATGKIGVTTSAGSGASANNFVVTAPPAPTIGGFTPTSGPVGTIVTISGSHFINVTTVKFNGVAASSFTVDSDTQIRATAPPGATSGKISVTTATGSAASATNFQVTTTAGPPAITSFSPPSGPVGTEVVINGANFVNVTGVKFNGVSASSFTIDSATQIHAVVPVGASVGKISVVTATGTAASATNFQVTTTAPPQYKVFLPMLKSGPSTASSSARAQYNALGETWQASSPFGYCTL
jgi:hypothetical protein